MSESPDIEHFKALLEQARADILAVQGTRDAAAATVELDQTCTGRLSRMDALQQQAMAQSGRQRAELGLRRIASALRRCEEGGHFFQTPESKKSTQLFRITN